MSHNLVSMEFDQQFVEFIVKALVNKPDEVHSDRKVDEQGVLITVHTSPEDTGYVIGKSGKTAVAIRTLLATIGAKANMRVSFRIDAPASSTRRPMGEVSGAPTLSFSAGSSAPAASASTATSAPVASAPLVSGPIDPMPDEDPDSVESLTF